MSGRLFPQRVDEVVEAAPASFSEQEPHQDRTLQRAAQIKLTPTMAGTQWP